MTISQMPVEENFGSTVIKYSQNNVIFIDMKFLNTN